MANMDKTAEVPKVVPEVHIMNRHRLITLTIEEKFKKGSWIMDVGCKRCRIMTYLNHLDFKTEGVDVDEDAVIESQQRGFNVSVDSVTTVKRDKFYDAVICSEVLEHIDYDWTQRAFDMLKMLPKNGGSLFITTPANRYSAGHMKRRDHLQHLSLDRIRHYMSDGFVEKEMYHLTRRKSCIHHTLYLHYEKL